MNIPENYDNEVERLHTHPDLSPAPEEDAQMLPSNSAVLKTALRLAGTMRKLKSKINFNLGASFTNKKSTTTIILKK